MSITVKHKKYTNVPDTGDSNQVQPSDWNDEHTVEGVQEKLESGVNIKTVNGRSLLGPGDMTLPAAPYFYLTTPSPIPVVGDCFVLPTPPMGGVVHNTALIYLDITPDDWAAGGSLINRGYAIEEFLNVRVEGRLATLLGAQGAYDGLHAQVSYITWVS